MASVYPFRAVRPRPEHVEEVASPPYDVVSTDEACAQADGRPRNFLHVARPEIDCPPETDLYDDAVYDQGATNLRAFVEGDYTVREDEPALYIYRLVMEGREQTGILGCVSVSEYDDGTIIKHEETRPEKEEDRTRHVLAQQAHAEPVMLTYRDHEGLRTLVEEAQEQAPLFDFEADDGVRHTVWRVQATSPIVEAFREREALYIADGHHRCKAASRAAATFRSDATSSDAAFERFPAVLFPMGDMHIMAYNRVVSDLPQPPADFLDTLAERFEIERDVDDPVPPTKGFVCLYLNGQWHRLALPPSAGVRIVDQLDVARLGEHLLEPLLGIRDPRRDPQIDFVGGIRGTEALEGRVDEGAADLAISMYPTSVEELVAVADEGSLMPPKSTWFEPKLRSGLLVHDFSSDVPEASA